MQYYFWFIVLFVALLFGTFLLRKMVFVLDATGRNHIPSKLQHCQRDVYFKDDAGLYDLIVELLKKKHFSVHHKKNRAVFFSSVFSPYPLRIEMSKEAGTIRLSLSDAHCQTMFSRYQKTKYTEKIMRLEREIKVSSGVRSEQSSSTTTFPSRSTDA